MNINPSSGIGPSTKITLTLVDVDLNEDPNSEDAIDFDVLKLRTDNDEISDSEIRLGEEGLEMGETDNNSGEFELTITLVPITPAQKNSDIEIAFLASGDELYFPAEPGDVISISYEDENHDRNGNDVINVIIEVNAFDPVISTDKDAYLPGDTMVVSVQDPDANRDPDVIDTIDSLRVFTASDAVGESFDATEAGSNTGLFTVLVSIVEGFEADAVTAEIGDTLIIEYTDEFPADYDPDDEDDKEFTHEVIVGRLAGSLAGSTTQSEVEVQDFQGRALEEVSSGQQVQLSTTVENSIDDEIPFVTIIEVRDTNGVTIALSTVGSTLPPEGETEVGVSFTPPVEGIYVRTFTVTNLASPVVLSEVVESEFEAG